MAAKNVIKSKISYHRSIIDHTSNVSTKRKRGEEK